MSTLFGEMNSFGVSAPQSLLQHASMDNTKKCTTSTPHGGVEMSLMSFSMIYKFHVIIIHIFLLRAHLDRY